jgi:predicted GNAT family acetyltransferase
MMSGVTNNEAAQRYELDVDGAAAVAAYRRRGNVVTFTHTKVPRALEGRGVGTRLIAAALQDVRQRGLRIIPECPFVASYVARHPDTQDLVAA